MLQIRESYSVGGDESRHKRRDLRGGAPMFCHWLLQRGQGLPKTPRCAGQHVGHVKVTAQGWLMLHLEWPEPYGGTGKEHFSLSDEDTLLVQTLLVVREREVRYQQVYHRQ